MSEKISGYPLTAASIFAGSFFDISEEVAPLVYVSKKVPAQLLLDLGKNIYNTDDALTGNRVVDGGAFILKFQNMASLQVDVNAVIIGANAAGGNITLNTNTDGALILPSSSDPDVDVTAPINGMLKYDATDDDIRARVGGAWISLLGGDGIYGGDGILSGVAGALTTVSMPIGKRLDFNSNGVADAFTVSNGVNKMLAINTANGTINATNAAAETWLQLSGATTSYLNKAFLAFHIGTTIGVGVSSKMTIKADGALTTGLAVQNGNATSTTVLQHTTAGYNGFGIITPSARMHIFGDTKIEGTTDPFLMFTDFSTNQISIGSSPYANTKFSITNESADTYSFLVLDQATTFEFSIREAGFVYTNGVFSAGNAAPTSASKIQSASDIELNLGTGWYYMGDPSTDGSWRMGFNGATDLVFERRIIGVWTNKGTFVG